MNEKPRDSVEETLQLLNAETMEDAVPKIRHLVAADPLVLTLSVNRGNGRLSTANNIRPNGRAGIADITMLLQALQIAGNQLNNALIELRVAERTEADAEVTKQNGRKEA